MVSEHGVARLWPEAEGTQQAQTGELVSCHVLEPSSEHKPGRLVQGGYAVGLSGSLTAQGPSWPQLIFRAWWATLLLMLVFRVASLCRLAGG